jgi:hypothetical protein
MLSWFARFLMLACGLLLALPPGWCCMAPFSACAQESAKGDAQQPRPCCQHADGTSKPSAPRPSQPAPPLPLGKCPCAQHALSTDAPKAAGNDLALAAPPPLIDSVPFPVVADPVVIAPLPTFDHSCRLLHCVWLC